jgi:hypothetical protein
MHDRVSKRTKIAFGVIVMSCLLFGIMAALLTCAGCTMVNSGDTLLIDDHLGNAQAMNNAIQGGDIDPNAVRQWIKADTASWQWFSDVAHHRTPTTMPVK